MNLESWDAVDELAGRGMNFITYIACPSGSGLDEAEHEVLVPEEAIVCAFMQWCGTLVRASLSLERVGEIVGAIAEEER